MAKFSGTNLQVTCLVVSSQSQNGPFRDGLPVEYGDYGILYYMLKYLKGNHHLYPIKIATFLV